MKCLTILSLAWMLVAPGSALACEANVRCESVQAIHVGKGHDHRFGQVPKVVYDAFVLLDANASGLKDAYAACPGDTLTIRIGTGTFEVEKATMGSDGDWFGVYRDTPEEAIDAAMHMCPDKVNNHLKSEPAAD